MRLGLWANRLKSFAAAAEPFLLWVFVSLLAIAWVGRRPYAALAIALLEGMAMGLGAALEWLSRPQIRQPLHLGSCEEGCL